MRKFFLAGMLLVLPSSLYAQSVITLNNSFIEKFKNRVTIDVNFTVDATSVIHPANQDGDIHVAGRAPEIGLPAVAEIMNARTEKNTGVKKVKSLEGTGTPVAISGAWRFWPEHGGQEVEVQGADVNPLSGSGAAHLFEVHPISVLDGRSLASTIAPTPGYTYKVASDAFTLYERTPCHIVPHDTTTTIITSQVGQNYAEFVMVLDESPVGVADGTMVFADVQGLDGEVLVKHRRMVFIKGTEPETAVKGLSKNQSLHVIGIPRIDLALVAWRAKASADPVLSTKFPQVLTWTLPYEMIIVGMIE